MKKISKFLSIVLVLCSIFTMLPAINIEAEAVGVDGVKQKLDAVIEQYPDGTYWTDTFDGGNTCYGFAKLVTYNVFGIGAKYGKPAYRSWTYSGKSESGMILIDSIKRFSAENIKELLGKAKAGDVLQLDEPDQHSMIVYAVGENSAHIYESNVTQKYMTRFRERTYEELASSFSSRNSKKLSLLRSDNYDEVYASGCDHYVNSTLEFAKYGYCTNCGTVDSQKVAVRNNAKTYQLTLDIMSRTGPYSAAPNAEQMFTGETFVALGEYENMIYVDDANHVWLRFEKNGRTCFVNTNSVTEIKAAPTLSVSDMKMPEGHFDSIRKFGLRGKFSSNYDITRILALVYDVNGKHILNYDVSPNKKSYNIQTDGLNDAFAFGKLPDGSYTYSVTAYDASGAEKNVSSTFSIGAVVNSAPAPVVTPTPTPAPTPAPVPTYLPVYEAPVLTPIPTQAPVYEAPVITPAPTQAPVYQAPAAPAYTPPQVFVSDSNITIDLAYNNSFLVQLAITGDAPAGCYFNLSAAGPFVCEWNNNYSFTVIANAEGAANLDVLLCDAYGQTIASSTIYVNVINSRDEFIFENPQIYSSYPETPQEPVYQAPEVSTLSITGTDQPSGYFASLSNYGLRGIVSSNYDITRILAYVYDAYGNAVLCYDTAPYRKSYDIQYDGLNNAFSFGSLPSGSYTYSVTAYDAYGAEKNVTSYFEIGGGYTASASTDIPIVAFDYYMTVNVGAGSTLRFCSYVSVADQYEIASIPNGTTVYVYGTTMNQYEDRTWAKINYNGIDGWVNYKWLS